MNGNVVRTITIRGTSEGLDKLQADLAKVAAGHKGVTVATEETEKSSHALEQALKRQSLRLDEVARAQNNIERETKLANKGLKEGLIDQQRHAELLNLANQRYGTTTKATQEFGKQTGLARHELINLGRQAQDVGVSLASGQSPLMILAQQGSQIADVFISSGKSVGSFFTQAIDWATKFATSPAGIVTGIAAIGAAAVYAASQFLKSSTTVEQAIEEQERLLKKTKTAIDELIAAQVRLQSTGLARFEMLRNEEDLRNKLNRAMKEAAEIGAGVATVPFFGTLPGYEKMAAAVEKLNAARAAGQPGLVEFNNELGKIGQENPELAKLIERMVKAGQEGINVEQAWRKVRAALDSVAQADLTNRRTVEAAEAAERQAVATLQMAQAYPGMSIEVAKQLDALNGQLAVAQAVGVTAQQEAQHRVTINQLLLEGKTLTEAIAIADKQRAIALAQIEAAHQTAMISLQGQLLVAQQITGLGQINAQHEANINNLLMQGLSLTQAIAQADMQRSIALAQVNTAAEVRLHDLQNEMQLIKAVDDIARDRIRSEQTLNRLLAEGVDYYLAQKIAAQELANATERRAQAEYDAANAAMIAAQNAELLAEAQQQVANRTRETAGWVAQTAADVDRIIAANREIARTHAFLPTWIPTSALTQRSDGTYSQFGGTGGGAGGGGYVSTTSPINVESTRTVQEQIEWLKQITGATEELTDATKANTSATSAMTDVLSPFYSSDPRRTHLGFRSFAGGGIMTQHGELPLKQYQGGGMATSPQVAVFGEGSTPEAYVPIPSGRIPVEIKQPANSNQRPVNVTINVMGNADGGTVAALKSTAFQQAQSMRRAMR